MDRLDCRETTSDKERDRQSRLAPHVDAMPAQCRATVYDSGPALIRHSIHVQPGSLTLHPLIPFPLNPQVANTALLFFSPYYVLLKTS